MTRALLLTALMVALPLAGCTDGDGSVQNVEAPEWRSGYAWAWNSTGQVKGFIEFNGDRQSFDEEVPDSSSAMEVLNTTTVIDGTPVYLTGRVAASNDEDAATCVATPEGEETCQAFVMPPRLEAYRSPDLAWVDLDYDLDEDCNNVGCRTRVDDLEIDFAQPYPFLDFPLESGKEWGGRLDRPSVSSELGDEFPIEWEYRAKVMGRTTVHTPLGPVSAIRVDVTERPVSSEQVRQAVMAQAEEECGGEIDGFHYDFVNTFSAYYSEEYEALARYRSLMSESLAASGECEGEVFDIRLQFQMISDTHLTGAQLLTKPERDLSYIGRVLTGEIMVADPAGVLPDPRDVSIELGVDIPRANAAAAEEATFVARLSDDSGQGLEGLRVDWSLIDYEQETVETGQGLEWTIAFDEPGAWGIQADVVDQATGQTLASQQIPYEAYYERTVTMLDGEVVGVWPLGGSEDLYFPVRPGVASLGVRAELNGPPDSPSFFSDGLVVEDAGGQQVASEGSDPMIVEIRNFEPYYVEDDDWWVEWSMDVSTGHTVDITIIQSYPTGQSAPLTSDNSTAEPAGGGMVHALAPWSPALDYL